MALLSSCWHIIEYVLIRDGFEKWYCLSFFIHPLLLIFCQFFIWIKLLILISVKIFQPFRVVLFASFWVFSFLKNLITRLFSIAKPTNYEFVQDVTVCEVAKICNKNQNSVILYGCFIDSPLLEDSKILEVQNHVFEEEDSVVHADEEMDESNVHVDEDMNLDESASFACTSELSIMESVANETEVEETDPFYKKYCERMRWFDLLNYERTCGISSILNKQLQTPSSFESIEPTDFSIPNISWSKMARRSLLRSLGSDFEMVYVGQSCLCWEALHHQYRKVETLASSTSQKLVFHDNVIGNFQKFQVLLERFIENERSEGKRYSNYVQQRFSLKSLLQVPEVSGYLEEEKEEVKGEAMNAKEVLQAIENSIRSFLVFARKDNKKSFWKIKSFLWTPPPLEDPKDLEQLADLTKALQKKELWLKDLQRKKRCWLKKANPPEECQTREILFAMIDLKLVSRVIKMAMISNTQLRWCQEKLSNIVFKEGRLIRASTSCLFPPS